MVASMRYVDDFFWETKFLFNVPRRMWRQIAAVCPEWRMDGRMPVYISVADKARQCVEYDRRCAELAQRRATCRQ